MITDRIVLGVLNNIALLLAMVLVGRLLARDNWLQNVNRGWVRQSLLGFVLSAIGLAIMLSRVDLGAGVVLDTRSVLISISGLFFGGFPTIILVVATGLYRISQGGSGMVIGVAVILASAAIGLAWRHCRRTKLDQLGFAELYGFGLLVHTAMLGLFLLIPDGEGLRLLASVSLPVMLIYPLGTAAVGVLLVRMNQFHRYVEALTASEQRYHTLFQNNHTVMLLSDVESGQILDANPAAARFYGWSVDELKAMRMHDITRMPPAQIRECMAQAAANEEDRFEFEHRMADGGLREVEVFSGPLKLDGRDCLYSIVHDISLRRKLEREMQILNRELRIKAQDAEAANRAKTQFLANMSHEMRTPLNGIVGMNELLADSLETAEQKEFSRTIGTCAGMLLNTINSLLDLAKIESGQVELKHGTFRLHDLLRSVDNILRPKAQEKGILLEFRTDDDLPDEWSGDFAALQQILLNLGGNAVKFTNDGRVDVQLTHGRPDGERYWLRVVVADTGIGINEGDHGRLFQKFSQLDDSDTRRYGGSGVGLVIVKRLVDAMGGGIQVSRNPAGIGSVFTVEIPLRPVLAAVQDQPRRMVCQASTANSQVSAIVPLRADTNRKPSPTVLVVEDNAINCRIISDFLSKMGVAHEAVGDGHEAVARLQQQRFDLVLMDIQMPVLNGVEATRRIRDPHSAVLQHDVPVVALTAHALKGDAERFLAAGMNDYLAKPVLYHDLRSMVLKWLGGVA